MLKLPIAITCSVVGEFNLSGVQMSSQTEISHGLLGLPQIIRFMSHGPDAQSAVEALLHGPFAHFGAVACHIYRYEEPNQLVLLGGSGLEEDVMARCQSASLEFRTPLSDAFFDVEIQLMSFSVMLDRYETIRIADEPLWRDYIASHGNQMLLCAPIVMNGIAVGAYSVFLPDDYALNTTDLAIYTSIGSLLGLWMTHKDHVRTLRRMDFQFVEELPVQLTDRQTVILSLIDEGRSVSSITRVLGYSPSTIRQELQRAMKILRVTDRAEAVSKAKELGMLSDLQLKHA